MRVGPYADTGDEFHPPVNDDDHEWAETCWFTFAVPERRLSGQQYCYFKPTLGVVAAAAYVWDDTGDQVWNCRYAKNFWHLPFPDASLSDLTLANGIRHRVRQPGVCYAIGYDDPDGDELHVDLTFTALSTPHLLGEHHLDQPGRCVGEIVLGGESIAVDSFGFRDRSWGRRTQYGPGIHETHCKTGGYSYATASAEEAFLAITLDFGDGSAIVIHGYLIRGGQKANLVGGRRSVDERDPSTGAPTKVSVEAVDELGRTLAASGTPLNRLGFLVNPNLWTWNCLTEWNWNGISAFGEDHDNWSVAGQREFSRQLRARSGGQRST
ncbi:MULTISPECIES: hypothetical protein [Mycobacterium]|uniref:Uncharacterized protein n=1 Tax=Mycobacterium kiyosense TaxID=2871094 RepID=A0A9P3Q870_9MYCO|nr:MULTISPECIES: hypothetical protein [Mycobacterium]BDB40176.1 hypothetical protein IWGMT90018_06220 [Mycobacterium kiyosense]BDE12008.1 hypothetical protein MKCMC460_08680 [Mycobacterium sp. 20KCMC460]GLB84249.1 hypothetical protein SRL2020028_35050 [Mycobacterium kiyosense]GLB91669.1 hypothetical protein SRL2020130_44860 [Mycobacterium kiyosense]GLB97656.1 hypothetical protein SRL2020226_44320 [Mycobacterium kiyosense]